MTSTRFRELRKIKIEKSILFYAFEDLALTNNRKEKKTQYSTGYLQDIFYATLKGKLGRYGLRTDRYNYHFPRS